MKATTCTSGRELLGMLLMFSCQVATAQSGPDTTPEVVGRAAAREPALPSGPYAASWDSLRAQYHVPEWLQDAKFGIFIHWGLYAVPAHGSEWYAKHMYANPGIIKWHTEKYGPPDKFGYKDFIPLFTCEKFNPAEWAALFKEAGAKLVVPTAEHHDGFALWDSSVNPWNAKKLGPHRELIGDLARAVRQQGLKFGISHHGMEHFTFIHPAAGLATDLNDPAWSGFYSVADRSDAACEKFLANWVAENFELIGRYQPDVLWFDNGVNPRLFDPLKLKVATYYYNRAREWGKEVTLVTKDTAYLAGSVRDFERRSRAPKELTDYVWSVDEPVLYRFGYTEGSPIASAGSIIHLLVDSTSKNGGLLLNISPKADGTIPEEQRRLLRQIGGWLKVNGQAIYGTRPWRVFGEGKIRFTTKGTTLYAILLGWPGKQLLIPALAQERMRGKVERVLLLGHEGELEFTAQQAGLSVQMPAEPPCDFACCLKIEGVKVR